jgi:hypothetical protein
MQLAMTQLAACIRLDKCYCDTTILQYFYFALFKPSCEYEM